MPKDSVYGGWPRSGEIDVMESRGNDCGSYNKQFGSTLHWGPDYRNDPFYMTTHSYQHSHSLADDMHTYGLIWTDKRLYTYIDHPDNIVLDVDMHSQSFAQRGHFENNNPWHGRGNNAPFDQEFYLILNVAVGGTNGFFGDNQCGKPWHNGDGHAQNRFYDDHGWYKTWRYPETHQSAMKIDSVKVWSLDGTEEYFQ